MVQFMAQRLMELDVEGRCGAGYDEKSAERLNSRNGYRERSWDTRAGSVELKIPKPSASLVGDSVNCGNLEASAQAQCSAGSARVGVHRFRRPWQQALAVLVCRLVRRTLRE